MGAKTWMLVYADRDPREVLRNRPVLDRAASERLATRLFPRATLQPQQDVDLSYACPPGKDIHIGCFDGMSVVAAEEFGIDRPSRLPEAFISAAGTGDVHLHAMHSVVDWFAFAVWRQGRLVRSLSLSPDDGIIEDIGDRLPFEAPYWAGGHPLLDEEDEDERTEASPFPFHPLELGEAALKEFFGYQLEGYVDDTLLEPGEIPLMSFRRRRHARWKFWK